ncbi:MAG: MBL fold metallo-hydrolase [Clostridia bacterium]|nr:MBL fold metallo-hydrolase [Clostridia bacterium]
MDGNIVICPLSSGSSGNSVLIQTSNSNILVDCGLTGKAVEHELALAGVSPDALDAIIVTHEHIDHISGVGVMCRRYSVPVFATVGTWKAMIDSIGRIDKSLIRYIAPEVSFYINKTLVKPFSTSHDAAESIGLIFNDGEKCGALVTDLGTVDKHIFDLLSKCSILMIEANHDENMLIKGAYPQSLKKRILSDCGHLSNRICGAFCAKLVREGSVRQIMLGHLSSDNNTPSLAFSSVSQSIEAAGFNIGRDVSLFVANRSGISESLVI